MNTSSTEFVESAKESSKYLREIGKYHFVLALAAAEVVAAGVPRKVIRKINFILNVKFEKKILLLYVNYDIICIYYKRR